MGRRLWLVVVDLLGACEELVGDGAEVFRGSGCRRGGSIGCGRGGGHDVGGLGDLAHVSNISPDLRKDTVLCKPGARSGVQGGMVLAVSSVDNAAPHDARSFGECIRAHDQQLRGVAWAVVRDQHQTDDVMQAAYEKAFRALPTFDGRSSISTWLHSIVYRTALDHVRYEGRRRHEDVDELRSLSAGGDSAAGFGVGRLELEAVMDQLSPPDRAALMLVAGWGYSYDEAAKILGEARGTVASRVSRARRRLERWEQ